MLGVGGRDNGDGMVGMVWLSCMMCGRVGMSRPPPRALSWALGLEW